MNLFLDKGNYLNLDLVEMVYLGPNYVLELRFSSGEYHRIICKDNSEVDEFMRKLGLYDS